MTIMAVWQWGECRIDSDSLMHYGISGQKHGVRRFQNDDGTLTSEGKARYAQMYDYGNSKTKGLIRRQAEKSHGVSRAFAEWREGRHQRNIDKANAKYDKKVEKGTATKKDKLKKELKEAKYKSKLEAQSAANRNLEAYRNHSGTGKLLLRSAAYEHARARGTGRLGSMVEAGGGLLGMGLRMHRDKKAYGKRIVYSAINGDEYTADGMND